MVSVRWQADCLTIAHACQFTVVQREPKWVAKGCKRSLRCVGFSGFKRKLMRLTWCEGFTFAATAAFPYDCDRARPYTNPDLCCVSHCMVPVSHARPDAVGGNRLSIPGVIAKNSIGLGDNMPAFDIGEDGVLRLARLDVFGIELGLQALHL